ncbi:MAG: C69 family dipeptidase, partial [Acidobacteriota bacterium]
KLMGQLGEKYGYGFHDSGEMLAVADPEEVWIFEIMPVGPLWTPESGKPGAVWCAQRVPDDHVSVCPNESRIGEIDVENKDMFLASSNVISLAVDKGFYDPEGDEPFSWKKAYSPAQGSALSSKGRRGRLWRFFDLVAPSKNFQPDTPNMDLPFSVKPDKKISLKDVMDLTRDKYKGSMFDPSKGIKSGPFNNPNYFQSFRYKDERYSSPRCISVNNVEYTTITVSRSWLPNPVGGVVWLSMGAQDTSCYMPLYAGMRNLPKPLTVGDHWEFNRDSARWAFDYVDFHTQVVYSHAIEDVKKEQHIWEDGAIKRASAVENTALELHQKDRTLAENFLTDYSISHALRVIEAWWDLGDKLLVKYNHLRIYDAEKRRSQRLSYTEEWKEALIKNKGLDPLGN